MDADTPPGQTSIRHYLTDEPALEDKFGAHERIAKGIANAIRANPELKVIGLIGPWGSGKSTVVGFVERELRADEAMERQFFTYDAWTHQNDPPRRAFLQELIHFLISKNLTSSEKWQRKLDQLNGQVEETTVTKTPIFTAAGAAIFFSILLSPFGASLLMRDGVENALHGTPSSPWGMIIGTLLLVAPILVGLIIYLAWRPIRKPWSKGYFRKNNFTGNREAMEGQSIVAMFMSKEVTNQKIRVARDPIPTAIEFQKIFREIMHAACRKNRQFVFVVDNLDRLPPDQAMEMWSTIRSFFLGDIGVIDGTDNTSLPTVILPLDEKAVQEIYESSSHDDNDGRASAFMEKTFDLTFRVTRPVLTDWQSYLRSQMTVLFGADLDETWIRQTKVILDTRFIQMSTTPITPRRINTLLNAIGVTWEQWKGASIPFASVVYYCAFRDLFDKSLQSEITIRRASIDRYDPNWQRSIAAIHYGVNPTVAYQVLLAGPLHNAMTSNNVETFASLIGSPGFQPVLHRVLQELRDVENLAPDAVMSSINVLAHATSKSSIDLSEEWQLLQESFVRTASWTGLGVNESEAVGHLLLRSNDKDRRTILVSTLSHALNSSAASDPNLAAPIGALLNMVDDSYPQIIEFLDELTIPNNPETFVRAAAACVDHPRILVRLKNDNSPEEIGVALLGNTNMKASEDMDQRFMAVVQTRHKCFNASFYEAAAGLLASANVPGGATALLALGFGRSTNDKHAAEVISNLVSTGRLTAIVTESWTPDTVQTFARASMLLMLIQPAQYPTLSVTEPMLALVRNLVEAFEFSLQYCGRPSNVTFGSLAKIALDVSPTRLLLGPLLSERVAHGQVDDFNGEGLFLRYDELRQVLGPDAFNNLLLLLARGEDFWKTLATRPVDQRSLDVLQIVSTYNPDQTERAGTVLTDLIQEIDSDTWSQAIGNPNIAIKASDLLGHLSSRAIEIPKLAVPLTMATDHVFSPPSEGWLERWFCLAELLPSSKRQTLLRTLRDRIINTSSGTTLLPILLQGGEALIVEGHFEEKADEFVRLLMPPFYTQPHAREYLVTYAVHLAPLIGLAAPETRQTVSDWLREIGAGAEDQDVDFAKALSASWLSFLNPENSTDLT